MAFLRTWGQFGVDAGHGLRPRTGLGHGSRLVLGPEQAMAEVRVRVGHEVCCLAGWIGDNVVSPFHLCVAQV